MRRPGPVPDLISRWRLLETVSTYTIYVERLYTGDSATAEEAEENFTEKKPVFNKKMLELEKELWWKKRCTHRSARSAADVPGWTENRADFPGNHALPIESLGGNAAKLIEDKLGFELLWSQNGSIPEYYLLIGGILQ